MSSMFGFEFMPYICLSRGHNVGGPRLFFRMVMQANGDCEGANVKCETLVTFYCIHESLS